MPTQNVVDEPERQRPNHNPAATHQNHNHTMEGHSMTHVTIPHGQAHGMRPPPPHSQQPGHYYAYYSVPQTQGGPVPPGNAPVNTQGPSAHPMEHHGHPQGHHHNVRHTQFFGVPPPSRTPASHPQPQPQPQSQSHPQSHSHNHPQTHPHENSHGHPHGHGSHSSNSSAPEASGLTQSNSNSKTSGGAASASTTTNVSTNSSGNTNTEKTPNQTQPYQKKGSSSSSSKKGTANGNMSGSPPQDYTNSDPKKHSNHQRKSPKQGEGGGNHKSQKRNIISTPRETDVIHGRAIRGRASSGNHPGNAFYRSVLKRYYKRYTSSPANDKPKFAYLIHHEVSKRKPPGRFLQTSEAFNGWEEMTQKEALNYILHVLNDCEKREKRRKMEGAATGTTSKTTGASGSQRGVSGTVNDPDIAANATPKASSIASKKEVSARGRKRQREHSELNRNKHSNANKVLKRTIDSSDEVVCTGVTPAPATPVQASPSPSPAIEAATATSASTQAGNPATTTMLVNVDDRNVNESQIVNKDQDPTLRPAATASSSTKLLQAGQLQLLPQGQIIQAGQLLQPGQLIPQGQLLQPSQLIQSGQILQQGQIIQAGQLIQQGQLLQGGQILYSHEQRQQDQSDQQQKQLPIMTLQMLQQGDVDMSSDSDGRTKCTEGNIPCDKCLGTGVLSNKTMNSGDQSSSLAESKTPADQPLEEEEMAAECSTLWSQKLAQIEQKWGLDDSSCWSMTYPERIKRIEAKAQSQVAVLEQANLQALEDRHIVEMIEKAEKKWSIEVPEGYNLAQRIELVEKTAFNFMSRLQVWL